MDDPWSIWTIYDPNGPDMVQMGPDGSDMARTGKNSSSNILRVMKRHVKTFALRDFDIFFHERYNKNIQIYVKIKNDHNLNIGLSF